MTLKTKVSYGCANIPGIPESYYHISERTFVMTKEQTNVPMFPIHAIHPISLPVSY